MELDPLAIAGAALVAKAALEAGSKKAGESAWLALSGVASWLRGRFNDDGYEAGQAALAKVEDAPDSPSRVQGLAEQLDRALRESPDPSGFRAGLTAQVDQAGAVGGEVGAFVVNVRDQAKVGKIVQIGAVHTNHFEI